MDKYFDKNGTEIEVGAFVLIEGEICEVVYWEPTLSEGESSGVIEGYVSYEEVKWSYELNEFVFSNYERYARLTQASEIEVLTQGNLLDLWKLPTELRKYKDKTNRYVVEGDFVFVNESVSEVFLNEERDVVLFDEFVLNSKGEQEFVHVSTADSFEPGEVKIISKEEAYQLLKK